MQSSAIMSDGEILCNFKKCRKVLRETAIVTRCSHAFCEEHGLREIEAQNLEKKCPACYTTLVQSYDLVRVVLNPSEQFKSMALAGIRPEFVMEIATRAIMFWTYQQHQEHLQQQMVTKHLKGIITQVKNDAEAECGFLKTEIQILKRKVEELEKELEKKSQRSIELSEKLTEKTREVQKWQMTYESLRRKQLSEKVLEQWNNAQKPQAIDPLALSVGPQTLNEILTQRQRSGQIRQLNTEKMKDQRFQEQSSGGEISDHKKAEDSINSHNFHFQPCLSSGYKSPKLFLDNLWEQQSEFHEEI